MNDDADVKGDTNSIPKPSAKSLNDGYNQTYVILKNPHDSGIKSDHDNDVFFRCGNWCYKGQIQFSGLKIGVADLSILIPTLQKQQGSLRYFCNSTNVPSTSEYCDPLQFLKAATEFVAVEMTSLAIEKELRKMTSVFPWIDADDAQTYFELNMSDVPSFMEKVGLVASKTYTRGLIIISIFTENVFYFVIQNGEGDQPLLDVHFPDVSKHGQGLLLQSYNDVSSPWRRLTLWHVLDCNAGQAAQRIIPKIRTVNVSNANYEQTYCVMKTTFDVSAAALSLHHDVLFRFGSWCYSGRVQLTPTLTLSDIPFVIPALRMQQGRLDYYCDVSSIPTNSPFAKSLEYMQKVEPLIEHHIFSSEDVLRGLIDRLSKMGLGDTVVNWLEGDPSNSFFEFKLVSDKRTEEYFKGIEVIASKTYHPSGVITVTIVFEHTIYVTILDGDKEHPLLDSRFPDVSGKGRGYQIQSCPEGLSDWEELRKVSVWQTVGALEQEFRDRATKLSQTKTQNGCEADVEACTVEGEPLSIDKIRALQQAIINTHCGDNYAVTSTGSVSKVDSSYNTEEDKSLDRTHSDSGACGSACNDGGGVGEGRSDRSPSRTLSTPHSSVPVTAEDKESPTKSLIRMASKISDIDISLDEGVRRQLAAKEVALTSPSRQAKNDEDAISSMGSTSLPLLDSINNMHRGLAGIARPHHIPKMTDSLGDRMEEIRRSLGDGALAAPWDSSGRPFKAPLMSRSVLTPNTHDDFK